MAAFTLFTLFPVTSGKKTKSSSFSARLASGHQKYDKYIFLLCRSRICYEGPKNYGLMIMKGVDFLKNRKMRILLSLLAVLMLVLAAPLFVSLNRFRPVIEQRCAEYLPVAVHLEGDLSFGLLPSPHLALEKIRVDNPPAFGTTPLLTIRRLSVQVAFWPLMHRRLQVIALMMEDPRLDIIKNRQGKVNIALPAADTGDKETSVSLSELKAERIGFRNLGLSYRDDSDNKGKVVQLQSGDLQLEDIVLDHGANSPVQPLADRLSLRGTLICKKISADNREYTEVKMHFNHHGGVCDIELTRAGLAGCLLQGKTTVDLRTRPVRIAVDASLLPGRGDEGDFGLEKQGELNLHADLDLDPQKQSELLATLRGKVQMQGHGLLVNGYDLDTVVEQYQKTSNVSLIDIGAFVVIGPLAALVKKGVEATGIRHGIGDVQTTIVRLWAEIGLAEGLATAEDVAFTTVKNRVAVKGKIDLARQRYRQLEVAVVDAGGCAEILQTIDGPLADPDLETAKLGLRTLGNPFVSLWKKAANLMGTAACQPFYQGKIPQPGQ